jgi:serine/threonine protein kinase
MIRRLPLLLQSKLTCISRVPSSTKSDIFSLGATMYEICLGRLDNLPENGQEWQDIRRGKLLPMPNTAIELQMIVREMMAPEWITRPSADRLLKRRQLMSDEQQQLMIERNKANVANMALDAQKVSRCDKRLASMFILAGLEKSIF